MTIKEIKEFLEESKDAEDVKAFIAEMSKTVEVTPELFKKFMESDDGKILVQPYGDQRATEAVKTRDKFWERERLDPEVKRRLAEELLKMNPTKNPLELEVEAMKKTLAEEKSERAKDQLRRQIVEKAAEMKVDPFFLEDYLPASVEVGELYLKRIAERDKKIIEKATNDLIAAGKFVPNSGKQKESKVDFSKLTQAEAIKLEMEGKLDDPS